MSLHSIYTYVTHTHTHTHGIVWFNKQFSVLINSIINYLSLNNTKHTCAQSVTYSEGAHIRTGGGSDPSMTLNDLALTDALLFSMTSLTRLWATSTGVCMLLFVTSSLAP